MPAQIPKNIKTIIWDLDGTILDSFSIFTELLCEVLPRYSKKVPTRDDMLLHFHGTMESAVAEMLNHEVTDEEVTKIVAEFLHLQDGYYEVIEHHLFPDAVSLMEQAHAAGKRQIIVTQRGHEGSLRASPRYIVEHSALKQYIDLVIAGDDSEHRKPKPEVLGNLKDEIVAGGLVVIGDTYLDAQLAQNLNSKSILVNRNDSEIAHLDELGDGRDLSLTVVASLSEVSI